MPHGLRLQRPGLWGHEGAEVRRQIVQMDPRRVLHVAFCDRIYLFVCLRGTPAIWQRGLSHYWYK